MNEVQKSVSKTLDDEHLEKIQARCDAATAGPWRIASAIGSFIAECEAESVSSCDIIATDDHGDCILFEPTGDADDVVADAMFVAAARTDVPDLIAEVRRLRDGITALHRPLWGGSRYCVECCVVYDGECIVEGHDHRDDKPICATVALFEGRAMSAGADDTKAAPSLADFDEANTICTSSRSKHNER